MSKNHTIAALATPVGTGGIAVIRLSGDKAISIAEQLFKSIGGKKLTQLEGNRCLFGEVRNDDELIDEAIATVFRAPKSYTGEDTVELSVHGGMVIVSRVLRLCYERGAQPAQPGEFTKRAFLNGKLSLTQAEAVMDLIGAQGEHAAKAAISAHEGALFRKIDAMTKEMMYMAGHLSAWIDYPEEDIIDVNPLQMKKQLDGIRDQLKQLLDSFDTGRVIREGIDTVIVGKPNVGKSTLMNLVTGTNRSIVTDIAGTTRDIVQDTVNLDGILLRLSDTAGIREAKDIVEQAGVSLALERLKSAQLILAVFDASEPLDGEDQAIIARCHNERTVAVINKTDLNVQLDTQFIESQFEHVVYISAKSSKGIEQLKEIIYRLFDLLHFDASAPILANERQRLSAIHAQKSVQEAIDALETGVSLDAVCVCIESALDYLLHLSGNRVTEAVVNEVFSRFCVGK